MFESVVVAMFLATDPVVDPVEPADPFDPVVEAFALDLDPLFLERFATPRAAGTGWDWMFDIVAIHEDVELEAVREDVIRAQFGSSNSTKLDEINREVDRRRTGGEIRFGGEAAMLGLALYDEDYEQRDSFDLIGVRASLTGIPRVAELGDGGDAWFILDYGISIAYSEGDGDVLFLDRSSGNFFPVEADIDYWNEQAWLGIGVDIHGFQVSVGGFADISSGLIDLGLDDDKEFESGNYSGYVRAGYRAAQIPLLAAARYFVGQYTGFAVELGVRF